MSNVARVGLALTLLVASEDAASAQTAEPRRVHFLAQVARGGGWLLVGAQADVAVGTRLRISPDLLLGEGASRSFALRVEGRESFSEGNATLLLVAALRVP